MALDTTARLIAEAQAKLAELDSRVASYRHEMATEFTRYSEDLLRNVPEDVADRVSQAIANSILSSYPSLYPAGCLSPSPSENTTNLSEISWNGNRSPPPVLPHTSGTPKGQPQSPHERELEFQGLFTPTYLPLLESVDRPLQSPPTSPGPAPTPATDTKLTPEYTNTSEGTQTPENIQRRRRPSPLRYATDTSIDSTASDSSSVRIRKSALRRSPASARSADSPRDPRRVRFDFEGQEVLPSSSPQASSTALPEWGSVSSGESTTPTDDSFPVKSLADIEVEEAQRPRKVSSSQALRALSKVPLDDHTMWTVVNPAAASEASSASRADNVEIRTHATLSPQVTVEHCEMSSEQTPERPKEGSARQQDEGQAKEDISSKPRMSYDETETEDDSSDDESSLFMLSRRNSKTRQEAAPARDQVLSTSGPSNSNGSTATGSTVPKVTLTKSATQPNASKPTPSAPIATSKATPAVAPPLSQVKVKAPALEDDEEPELFSLDADDDDLSLKKAISAHTSPKKHLPEVLEEPEQNQKADEQKDMSTPNAPIPGSPPISIPIRPPSEIPPKVLPMPQGSVPKVSIGSLGGRSLIMSPVKDPELLERIRKSDDAPPFWVGSVNGNSGVDASNVKSYVASLPSPKGMPESFFERYIRERDTGLNYASDREDSEGKT
ncbi:hypothetical protein VM1G_00238 [Cytospora mali]|uniref:Uncharacterized protein n=1 Tax=Cytospora mali TaxID=578113 RepID=A0A194VLG1_CYTMA|nr:hypothetical protein VM1G_00238 [Valsa mali]